MVLKTVHVAKSMNKGQLKDLYVSIVSTTLDANVVGDISEDARDKLIARFDYEFEQCFHHYFDDENFEVFKIIITD